MLCKLSGEYIRDGYTQIDNAFLLKYLPSGDDLDVKLYLYGLTLATLQEKDENTVERIALALKITEDRVLQGFKNWEEKGLISLSKTVPPTVTYLSVKNPATHTYKYKAKEMATFTEEMSRLFPDKVLFENDLTAYFDLIASYKISTNAMLGVVGYCKQLGKTSTPYIIAVATDWAKKGMTTEKAVDEHISRLESNTEELKILFATLGIKKEGDLDDRQSLQKWKDLGYTPDVLNVIAKSLKKKGGMKKLDDLVSELRAAGAFSAEEVAAYLSEKNAVYELTLDVVTQLGGWYSNLDAVIENYTVNWRAKGFTDGALKQIARFCFLRGIKSLDGMNQIVSRFHKQGLLNENVITAYVARQAAVDESIAQLFDASVNAALITNRDREFYATWADDWGFSQEIIVYCAELVKHAPYPMQKINRMLATLKAANAFSLEEAKKILAEAPQKAEKPITDDDIKHVFTDFTSVIL